MYTSFPNENFLYQMKSMIKNGVEENLNRGCKNIINYKWEYADHYTYK